MRTGLDHRRTPKYEFVDPKKIKVADDGFDCDEQFTKLYVKVIKGKLPEQWARIPIEKIRQGSLRRMEDGSIKHVKNCRDDSYVGSLMRQICRGYRQPVYVYASPFSDDGMLECPDDERKLMAYDRLGVRMIPCVILGNTDVGYPSLSVLGKIGDHSRLQKVRPHPLTNYRSLIGVSINDELLLKYIDDLISSSEAMCAKLRAFHVAEDDGIHYHHQMYSCLSNNIKTLGAMRILFLDEKMDQIVPLIRMMYEAFLNFYVDWMAPHYIGQMLQFLAAIRRAELSGEIRKADLARLFPNNDVSLFGFSDFLQSVKRKASISSLGDYFYENVYPQLSFVAHQDYLVTSGDSGLLSGEAPQAYDSAYRSQLIRWADLITAALLEAISSDVGRPISQAVMLGPPLANGCTASTSEGFCAR